MADQKLTDKSSISSIDDSDLIHVVDVSDTSSSVEGTSKKGLFSLFKSTLKTYFDTLYSKFEQPSTTKTTPVDADTFTLWDSAASFAAKKLNFANLKATLKTYFDSVYFDKTTETSDDITEGSVNLFLTSSERDEIAANTAKEGVIKYNTVAAMISASPSAGDIVTTLGYTTANDGGGNTYRIVDDGTLTQDYGAIINITGDIYAVAVNTGNLTNMHYGIFSDSSTNWVSTASARFSAMLDAAVNYGITFSSPPGTYFNCELNLDESHSGAFIHFNNAVFSDLIHIVGTDKDNKITGMTLTGHLTTYGRYGTTFADNIVGDLNLTLKADSGIQPDGENGRGVHIYHSTKNHNYGNIVVEYTEDAGSAEAAVAIDGITDTTSGNTAPENINIQSIWVQDSDVRGVQITGLNHHIGSIRVDRYGSSTFNKGMPSMNTTTYNGESANQIAQGVLFLYTNAVVDLIIVDQADGFTGRSRALTDVFVDRYTLTTNPVAYTRTVPTIGTIISKNPQRQVLSVGETQRTSGVNVGHVQIYEISSSNVLEVNASGERADYGLVDLYLGTVNIGSIHCHDYKNVTLLQQLDQSYNATVEQQVLVNVGSISKEVTATTGKGYDIFQGNIDYILINGDANNKSGYHTKPYLTGDIFLDNNTITGTGNINITGGMTTTAGLSVNTAQTSSVGLEVKGKSVGWASRYNSNGSNFSGFYFLSDNASFYLRNSAGTTKSFITSNGISYFDGGNVAIGKTSASEKLDVDGNILASGDIIGNSVNGIYRKKVSLSSAQILNLYDTPIEAIAAPGAGKVIVIHQMTAKLTYGTATYGGPNSAISLVDSTLQNLASTIILGATADSIRRASLDGDKEIDENSAIDLYVSLGNPTTGDSPVDVYITYEIIEL